MNGLPVWITGLGMCTPCGHDTPAVAAALLDGRSAIQSIQHFDISQHPSQMAAAVAEIPFVPGIDTSGGTRTEQAAIYCVAAALRSADLWDRRSSLRIGLVLGIGSEWFANWEADHACLVIDRPQAAAEVVRKAIGLNGPAIAVSAACASGNHALALARSWLRQGVVDVCVAGGCDMTVTPLTLAGFGNLRALSRRNDDPAGACRPFDRARDGFVLGEGGAFCVLERAELVRRRRGHVFAEVAGFGATSDAHHLVIPSPEPAPAANAMRLALADAGVSPDEIDYINAHGTGTPVGDVTETAALHEVFGRAIDRIPVSSTKATSGHLLTAAAAFEAIAGIIAMDRGAIPPTLNLTDPDPACALNHVPRTAQERSVRTVLSNSFGFGGSNTALVLRKVA